MQDTPTITLILLIMTGFISYQAFNNPEMRAKLIFHPATIKSSGEYYRFLTSGFIHGDWGHLFINMFVLYQFGRFAEEFVFPVIFGESLGRFVYLIFYLAAIVLSSVPTYFRHKDHYGYSALGASGATSALVFAYIIFLPWEWFIFPPLPAFLVGIGFILYSSYMDKRGNDNIGHNAHLWGAVFGLFFIVFSVMSLKPALMDVLIEQMFSGRTIIFG